jgi:hypothetical protein
METNSIFKIKSTVQKLNEYFEDTDISKIHYQYFVEELKKNLNYTPLLD